MDDITKGDARRSAGTPERGPEPEGGLPPEKVEDRPSVGTVKPEDYPMDRPDR
jgi:hypothetical protein